LPFHNFRPPLSKIANYYNPHLICVQGLFCRDHGHRTNHRIPCYSSSSSTGRLALARILSATNCGTMS
jgi:hypothetical protein